MPVRNNYFDFYIKSSLHVGLAVFSLVQLSIIQLNSYAFLVFFGTILGYNFLKYSKSFSIKYEFDKTAKAIVSITFAASIGCVVLFLIQEYYIQIHVLIALLLVVMYPSVRKTGWIKLFYVAFVVTFITVYIPLMNLEEVVVISLQRFLLLSSVIIPFEISDSTTDSAALKTLPHLFGIQKTKLIGYVLVVLFCIVSFHADECLHLCFIYAISSMVAIYFSSSKRSWYFTSFWVESLPIVWWLISIVFQ